MPEFLSLPGNIRACTTPCNGLQVKAVGPYISCEVSTHVQGPLLALDRYASGSTAVEYKMPGLHLPAAASLLA